jgi:hypothetical protein
MMNFGLKFMKQKYINAAVSYHKIIGQLTKQHNIHENEIPLEKIKYILKLSKAILCIVVRNLIDKKIFKYLKEIKYADQYKIKINHNQISFFKPKK